MLAKIKKHDKPSDLAGLAQLVEQRIRNAWVGSSSLLTGTIKTASLAEAFFMVMI